MREQAAPLQGASGHSFPCGAHRRLAAMAAPCNGITKRRLEAPLAALLPAPPRHAFATCRFPPGHCHCFPPSRISSHLLGSGLGGVLLGHPLGLSLLLLNGAQVQALGSRRKRQDGGAVRSLWTRFVIRCVCRDQSVPSRHANEVHMSPRLPSAATRRSTHPLEASGAVHGDKRR